MVIILCVNLLSFAECKNNQYFSVDNLFMRIEPNQKSNKVIMIPRGKIINFIAKGKEIVNIDGFSNYWYNVEYSGKKGWVYGGYIVEFIGQDINEFIKRYEFIRYFQDGWEWFWKSSKESFSCELTFGFGGYNKYLTESDLILNFQVFKDSFSIFDKKFVISKFVKMKNGYKLYCKGEYIDNKDQTSSIFSNKGKYIKQDDYIAIIGTYEKKLIIYDIIEMKTERKDGKKFNSTELKNVLFESSFTNTYFN